MDPRDDTPVVSVVICTRNRAADLARALDSLRHQHDAPTFEVIVVDNASTDNTPQVVEACTLTAELRRIVEPTLGLCHARNTGWRAARGRYVAYLDDDAVACSSWVSAVTEAFARCPDAGAVGGRVDPVWMGPQPDWLSDHVALGLTIVNWPGGPKVLPDLNAEWLVGANMAVRKDLLAALGGFRPDLDRVGNKMLSSGDVFLLKEVARRGAVCFYHPAMAVEHLVPRSRLTQRWFRQRYYWQGVSDAIMVLLERRPTPVERRALARRAVRQLFTPPARMAALLPTKNPQKFAETCWTLIALGQAIGLLGAARVSPEPVGDGRP